MVQTCVGVVGLVVKPGSWEAWTSQAWTEDERAACASAGVRVKEPEEGIVVAGAELSDETSMPEPAVLPGGIASSYS